MESFGYEFSLQVANFAGAANLKLIIFKQLSPEVIELF